MTMKHPAEWATITFAATRRNGRTPFKIAKYAVRDAELFEFPVEQPDRTHMDVVVIDVPGDMVRIVGAAPGEVWHSP